MRVRASSASAVVVSLLINDALAGVHGRHDMFHRKRTQIGVTVTDEVIETKTEVIYVTVEWPGGETLGVQYPTDMSAPAASTTSTRVAVVPAFSASSAASSVTDTFTPVAAPKSTPTPAGGAQFLQESPKASTPPAAPPTTLATVVVAAAAAASTPAAVAPAAASTPPAANSNTIAASAATDSTKKRGVAFNDVSLTNLFVGSNSHVSWCYNWGQTGLGAAPGLEYIPTLWNNDPSRTKDWNAAASLALEAGSRHIFSFNEPDLDTQAHMTVADSVSAYKEFIQPFAGRAKLGAPAVTAGPGQMGLQYMENFLNSCTGCTIDFVNIHWYDSATNFPYFKKHVEEAHARSGGRPVWITEFAASGSEAEQTAFLEVVIPWLDAQPYVERYAYFMAKEGVLVSGKNLNTLGSTFVAFASSIISSLIGNA